MRSIGGISEVYKTNTHGVGGFVLWWNLSSASCGGVAECDEWSVTFLVTPNF